MVDIKKKNRDNFVQQQQASECSKYSDKPFRYYLVIEGNNSNDYSNR